MYVCLSVCPSVQKKKKCSPSPEWTSKRERMIVSGCVLCYIEIGNNNNDCLYPSHILNEKSIVHSVCTLKRVRGNCLFRVRPNSIHPFILPHLSILLSVCLSCLCWMSAVLSFSSKPLFLFPLRLSSAHSLGFPINLPRSMFLPSDRHSIVTATWLSTKRTHVVGSHHA